MYKKKPRKITRIGKKAVFRYACEQAEQYSAKTMNTYARNLDSMVSIIKNNIIFHVVIINKSIIKLKIILIVGSIINEIIVHFIEIPSPIPSALLSL